MKRYCLGILAHADAGKTTLSEAILYKSGIVKQPGRVDHGDTVMDYDGQEKQRGITIYSKEASFSWKDSSITLIDTPGHADFSAEMERSLSVLDAAILVISASEGVQAHTLTIWNCLQTYQIPTIIFVNKMDLAYRSREDIVNEIQTTLSSAVTDLEQENAEENLALASDDLLEIWMENGRLDAGALQEAFMRREVFPLYTGSALKLQGIDALLDGLDAFMMEIDWPEEFGAKIFRIEQDQKGQMFTHLKITGGSLKNRQALDETHKADQLKICQGQKYLPAEEIFPGMVCALKGLSDFKPGSGLGFEKDSCKQLLSGCLQYELLFPKEQKVQLVMEKLRPLILSDPTLDLQGQEESGKILIRLMGEIQKEILLQKMEDLCGFPVNFGNASVLYKETIASAVYGYGHFEPLRHYAEVHLKLEPLPPGSGLQFASSVSTDSLAMNWQRLILTHLQEKRHKGVLTRSDITDMKITLIAGRAHAKHTMGGDFRQATYRAVRQGLMKADSILLEPYYSYTLRIDRECLSRAMFDLERRNADIKISEQIDGRIELSGRGPVRTMMNMQPDVLAYSKGKGILHVKMDGYAPCQVQDQLIDKIGYDPVSDLANPPHSVFCAQGAGYTVEWDEVEEHLHIPLVSQTVQPSFSSMKYTVADAQAKAAFENAGGRRKEYDKKKHVPRPKKNGTLEQVKIEIEPLKPVCLIVDGYNMLYSWEKYRGLARSNLAGAREELAGDLINYCGYKNYHLILVFDGYKVKDNPGSNFQNGTASIVYTRYSQSADSYIEKKVRELKNEFRLLVASSDGLIQNSILSAGAARISSRELESRVRNVNAQAMKDLKNLQQK